MSSSEMSGSRFDLGGVTFDAIAGRREPSSSRHFKVRKTTWMVERYFELAGEFEHADVVELGVDKGASTAMLTMLLEPRRLAAFEISRGPVEALDEFVRTRQLQDVVRLHWGVDQSDTASLLSHVDADFGDRLLDLVIDDASHERAPTAASFHALFPRLRPGGLFIIEDWSHTHFRDRALSEGLRRDDENSREVARLIEAHLAEAEEPPVPLSHLVLELILVSAYAPEIVESIRVREGWCEVRRGPGSVPSPFAVRDHLGFVGGQLLPDASPPPE